MKSEKISIKWKIFIYMLVFTVILLVILWLFQIAYLDSFYKMIKTKEAENISGQLISLLQTEDEEDIIDEQIDSIAAANNVTVLVTDTEGETLYSAEYNVNAKMGSIPLLEFERYYQAALDAGGSTKIEFEGNTNMTFKHNMANVPGMSDTEELAEDLYEEDSTELPKIPMTPPNGEGMAPDDSNFMQNRGQDFAESVIYVNLVSSNGTDYVVMLNSVLTPVDSTVQTLKVQLVCISLVMVGLSLVIALLMSKKVSKSMIKVSNSAQELAAGNYEVEFEGRDYREIAELSNTLNYTARELGKTESLRRELIANVSHDLRTPLTMIIAYSEVMRDLPGENSPENIQVVIDESKRLTNLVNDMLDISKLQAGVLERTDSVFNLTESIRSVLTRYNKLKEQDGYTIDFHYDEEIMVCADEFKIYQVVYNLINNAINYTGEDKKVVVSQLVQGDRVRLEVADTGEGIEEDKIPYVWDRYYRVDKTHKRAITGTGLGLSIVKNILKLHNAAYGVESTVGVGSTFWFELPIEK